MLTPITLPPGVFRNGTVEQSKARFYDCNLARWNRGGLLTQMMGWRRRDATQVALSGAPRACLAWQDNNGDRRIAVGTNQKLYVQTDQALMVDITPSSIVTGPADGSVVEGYGAGGFGVGPFGTARPEIGTIPAAMWSLDLWNDRLVGVMAEDGRLVQWNLDTTTPAAAISGAPTGQKALVVTAEGFLMAFANRTVRWSDQAVNTTWTPSDTNQARSFNLQTSGQIQGALKATGATLILTTTDAWTATYVGFPIVYGFQKVGSACGMVSRGAGAAIDQRAAWMGREGFYLFDGYVRPLPCDIADLVFGDINEVQLSKVTCGHRAATGEVWWNYCSAGSNEIDRQVIWNYALNCWYPSRIARSCMSDAGVFSTPIMVSPDGYIYAHETGFDHGGATPFAETGPLRLGNGDARMEVSRVVPDERNSGDFDLTFLARDYPDDADVAHGPYVLVSPTDMLFQAGRVRLRYRFLGDTPANVGDMMLDLTPGDRLT